LFSNIGTNTHAQIDTHIADSTIHFTVASIDHTAILNIGTNSHADIDSHISSSNPHSISVGATNPFGTDNVLLRSDLTGRLAQATGISVDDSENISGVAGIGFTGTGTAGTSTIYRSSSGVFVIKVSGDGSAYDFQLVSRSGNALISNSANTTNLLIGAGNGSLTFNSNDFIVDTVNGIDLNDSSSGDVDYDIITVAVTDNPKFWWDESEDTFSFTKGITTTALKLTNPLDEIYGGTGLSTIAIGSILYTNASDTLTALTGVAGDDGEFLRFNWNGGSPTLSWEAGGGGGGEANTMSSQGSGTSLYYQKSGVDLQLNAIKSENDRLSVALDGVTHDVELTLNEGNIVHQNLSGAGTNDHSAIDTHLGSSSNPHTVTKAQVGLTNVPDVDCTDADNISDGVTNAIITLSQETNFESAYTHSGLTSGNPHSVSKSDVSLGNVVNLDTSDADNISDGVTNAIITLTQETNFETAYSNSHAESHSIASHSDTTATGAELEELTDGSETTLHTHAGTGGDVTASSPFGTDNVLIKSDGTGKGVQATGIAVDDSDNVSGINKLNVTVDCLLDPTVADGASAVAYNFDTGNALSTSGAKLFDFSISGSPRGYIDIDGSYCIGTQSARSDWEYGCDFGFRGDKHTADLTNGDKLGLFTGFVDGASWNEYAMVNSYVSYGTTSHDIQFEMDAQQVGVSASGLLFKGRSNTTATNSYSQFEMYSTGSLYFRMTRSGTKLNFEPTVADGASSIAYKFDTLNDLATAGAKIVSIQHQAVEKFYIAKDRSAIIGDGDITGTNVLGTTWSDYNTNWLSYFGGTASNLDDITVVRGSKADYYGLMLLTDGGSGAGVHVWDDAQAYPFFIFTGWNTGHIIYYGGGSWGDCWDAEEHRWYVDPDGVSINSGVLVMQLNASGLSLQYNQTIDHTHAEALLVRRNGDTGDVFIVDTTNGKVTIDAIDDSAEKPALVIMGGGTTYEHHIQFNSADNATNTTLDKTQLDSIINHVGASNPHSGSAGSGANSDITSLTGLTTPLDEIYGGTGQSTIAVGDLLYGSASNVLSKLTKGSKGQVLRMDDSGTNVEWDTPLKSKSITIENPTSSEDISMFFTNKAITITEIRAVVIGTTPSVTWTIRHNATDRSAVGNEVVTSGTTTTSTTSGSDVTSFNDATIPADSFVWMETTAQTGTVTELHITIIYRETTT
jgi:hypothetical protein